MADQISQSFKVQWINTTLKYLKDDNQLIMKYPDMPVNHLEYLRNLIWERKHGVEFGFKSMYAPVWEAMKIFALKYKFKVTVNKSEDSEKGHLVIEKILRRDKENMEPAKPENLKQANEIPHYQSTDSKDDESETSQSQSDSQTLTGARTKKPTKTKKKTNSEKFFVDKQKIIESISPVLLRKALKNILDFLLKKEEASIIFSDLAPVEARFLENFLGIYNKRVSFRDSLSPACNVLLDKMCEFFKEFDKQCKLEVYPAKYNVHTQKREVTFMKVPRYTRTNANQSQKQIVAPQMIAKDIQSVSLFKNNAKIPKPLLSQTIVNSNLKITIPIEKSDGIENRVVKLSMNKVNREEKLSVTAEIRDKMSMNKDIKKERLTLNKENREETYINAESIKVNEGNREKNLSKENGEIDSGIRVEKLPLIKENIKDKLTAIKENGEEKSNKREEKTSVNRENGEKKLGENKLNENNTKAENSDTISNKEVKSIKDTKDNKLPETIKITDDKLVVLNKELLKQEIAGIAFPKDTSKTIIPVKKIDNPPIAHNRIMVRSLGTRKEKLLEAMSTPLESDKAMRMMRLMGWQGGALGPRGDGIVEPIIPALDIVRGKGLGHVRGNPTPTKPVKPVKSVKSVKPVVPVKNSQVREKLQKPVNEPRGEEKTAPAKPVKRNVRVEIRIFFLKSLLDLINRDMSITAVTYPVELCKKEKKCYNNIIHHLNRRLHLSLTEPENLIMTEILQSMGDLPELSLDLTVTADLKELTITKMLDSIEDTRSYNKRGTRLTGTENSQNSKTNENEDVKLTRKMTQTNFKTHICSTVLDFLKSSDTERWIDFDATLTEKYCSIVDMVCFCVNKKVRIPFQSARDMAGEILEIGNKCFLDVQFEGRPTRSFLLRKFYHRKPCINNEVLKQILQRYTDTVLPDKDGINEHKDAEAGRTNSDKETSKQNKAILMSNEASHKSNPYSDKICERLNPRNDENNPDTTVQYIFIDSVRNSVVVDEDINENRLKTNEEYQCYDHLKLNNHAVNDCKDISDESIKKIKRLPLYVVKYMNMDDHNDFRRIDMDLLQVTINSLTHTENLDDIKIELHDNDLLTTDYENNPFNINDYLQCTESSKLSDKQDISCELTHLTNMRKWYDHSEKFLMCDDLVKYTLPVKTIDSNNNRNEEANFEVNKYIEEKLMNIHLEINSSTHVEEKHIKLDLDDVTQVKIHNEDDLSDYETINSNGSPHTNGTFKLDTIQEESDYKEYLTLIMKNPANETPETHSTKDKVEENSIKDNKVISITDDFEISPKEDKRCNKLEITNIETDCNVILCCKRKYDNNESDEYFKAGEKKDKLCINKEDYSDKMDLRLTSDYKTEHLEESKNTEGIISELDIVTVKTYNNENATLKSEFAIENPKKSHKIDVVNSKLDIDYNGFKHTCGNQTKDLNNTNTEIDRTYDVVLIESNILEVEVIQKKIQNKIESIDPEVEFLPVLRYHGILNRGLVYSCHNNESSLWLRNILPNYSVIDYRSAISNHKLKIKVASLNKDAKKFLGLLESYNQGLNTLNWNIISEKHYNYSLILCVQVDSDSFEYICDKKFSLFVGYDVAQFSIGC